MTGYLAQFLLIGFAVAVWAAVVAAVSFLLEHGHLFSRGAHVRVVTVLDSVRVEIVNGGESTFMGALSPAEEGFDERLHEAVSAARSVAITMREADRSARRKLP